MTAVSPATLQILPNEYYKNREDYSWALAEAFREEYRVIVDAGFILQIDDPASVDIYDWWFSLNGDLAGYRRWAEFVVEAVNHALQGIPEDRVRFHICWGSWHGPHSGDVPLREVVDLLIKVKAQAYSVEAGNVRHEHEWKAWKDTKLPEGTREYVAGYAIGLDVTIRGAEDRSWRKSFDSFAVLGPWVVTADEIPDPNALDVWLKVNGELRRSSNTRAPSFSMLTV